MAERGFWHVVAKGLRLSWCAPTVTFENGGNEGGVAVI